MICTMIAPILLALLGSPEPLRPAPMPAPMPEPIVMPATTPGQSSEWNDHPVFTTPMGNLTESEAAA